MKHFLVALLSFSFVQILPAQDAEVVAPISIEVTPTEVQVPKGLATFWENNRMGLRNHTTNTIVLPAEYAYISQVDADHFIVRKEASGVFHVGKNELVLPMEFEDINFLQRTSYYQFSEGTEFMIIVKKGKKYGLMDQRFAYILQPEYEKIDPSHQYLKLVKGGKAGVFFLERKSKDLPLIYDEINEPDGIRGLVAVQGERYSLFDQSGKAVVENYKRIDVLRDQSQKRLHNKVLLIDQKGKCGIYDSEAKAYLLKVKYDGITDGYEDRFVVRKKSKYGVVAKGDQIIIPFSYDSIVFMYPRKTGTTLLALSNKKFGVIDLTQKVVVPFQYEEIKNINAFYKAKSNGKYTVLDNAGKAITSSVFDDVGSQHYGKMAVFNEGKIGYMDTGGNIIQPVERPSPARGYSEVDMLFKAFEKAIRSDNDSLLLEFCRDVVYDAYSQEFFQRIGYQYRGFPNKMIEKNFTIDDVVKQYYKAVVRFRQELKDWQRFDSFEFVAVRRPGIEYIEPEGLRATETWGVFKTRDRTMEIKLGELIDVDGYWKSFTNFRSN